MITCGTMMPVSLQLLGGRVYLIIFKAADYYGVAVADVTSAQAANIASAIKAAGMSAWQHYIDYGTVEGINPSNNFDTNKYLKAKLEALQAADPETYGEWTTDDVAKAISDAGMNALSHAIQYADGTTAGEAAAPFNADGSVIDAYKVDNKASGDDAGSTFVLTSAIDNLTGTSGDDTFTGDFQTTSAADTLDGGDGTDTLKLYATDTLPSIKNIENVYVTQVAGPTVDVSKSDGVKALELEANTGNATVTLTTDQSLSLKDMAADGALHTIGGNTPTELAVTLDGVTRATAGGAAPTLAFTGTALTTLNLTAANNASVVTLTNAGGKLATANVLGDAKVTVTEALTTLTTVNAAENSAGVTWNANGGAKDLTFTGGLGDDTLSFAVGQFDDKDVVDMGEGKDTVILAETAALTAAQYSALNAVKNAEVLGVNGNGMAVDASQLTNGMTSFNIGTGATTATVTNIASGAEVSINNGADHTSVTLSNAAGNTSAALTITNGTSAAHTITTLDVSGVPTVTMNVTGEGATTITTLTENAASLTISGDQDLTITNALSDVVRVVDASAFEGALTVTGGALNDTITGGKGNDVLGGGAVTAGANAVEATAQVSTLTYATDATAAGTITLTIGGEAVEVAVDNGADVETIAGNTVTAINENATVRAMLSEAATSAAGVVTLNFNNDQAYAIEIDMGDVAGTECEQANEEEYDDSDVADAVATSNDVLKGGDGEDTFVVGVSEDDLSAIDATTTTMVVQDFADGTDLLGFAAATTIQNAATATTYSNFAAMKTAATAGLAATANSVWMGQVGSDTYLFISNGNAGEYVGVVELVGVPETAITADDFTVVA